MALGFKQRLRKGGPDPPALRQKASLPVCVCHRRTGAPSAAAAGTGEPSSGAGTWEPSSGAKSARIDMPWHFGAQTNERLLQWDESAQGQLMRIWLCGQLGVDQAELDVRLAELGNLLPDMVAKLHAMRAPLVLHLLQNMPDVAAQLLRLHALLPGADVSAAVAQRPELFLQTPLPDLEAAVASLAEHLPGVAVGPLVEREPMLLRADIRVLLNEARRLMPGKDPVAFIAADPGALIGMEVAGLPSTLEHN